MTHHRYTDQSKEKRPTRAGWLLIVAATLAVFAAGYWTRKVTTGPIQIQIHVTAHPAAITT